MDEHSIGSRIKSRRNELNLTQSQIKEATGISSGNQSEIENGKKLPSTPTLISLSNVLDCSIDWLLKGEVHQSESIFLSNERAIEILSTIMELSEDEQEEILMIAKFKLEKRNKTNGSEQNSLSGIIA